MMKITSIPQIYRHVNRWRRILAVASKYGLADWISRYDLHFAQGLFKDRDGELLASHSREARIRLALSELGPTFIKLGQVLSTRADVVGAELASELAALQDSTPADSAENVRQAIERELGRPLAEVFSRFDDQPLASASIGQVHAAWLPTGEAVVVKVQHAGIEDTVRVDLDILVGLAQLAEGVPELKNYRPGATVHEFQRTLKRELDFGRELRSMQRFAADFSSNAAVHIPRPYPELSTSRVLVMERLEGVKLSEAAQVAAASIDLDAVALTGAQMYMEMVFDNGFYHADPHPGNIVLLPEGVVGLLDFGMVGQIDEHLREDIEDMLLAISQQDAERLTAVIMRAGDPPPGLDQSALALEVGEFVAHYAHQSLDEFDLSGAIQELTDIIRRYGIRLPARVALLLKLFIMLEGTARLVSPRFALIDVMKPYQTKMLWRRLSPARQARKARRVYYELERLARVVPQKLTDILQQMEMGRFDVHLDHRGLEPSVNRLVLGLLSSATFLGSTLLLSRGVLPVLWGVSVPGAIGTAISLVLGARALRGIRKY